MVQRNTIVGKKVLDIIALADHPLSVIQIQNELEKKDLSPNKTTIYRVIQKLIKNQLVSEVSIRNKGSYFELLRSHHHHFICNHCDVVYCLQACHVEQYNINLKELLPNKHFKIEYHDFNLYGHCDVCVSK